MHESFTEIPVANTLQQDIESIHGITYRIFVSWPLTWKAEDSIDSKPRNVNVLYVVDGNAYFHTTMEDVRRKALLNADATDVVVVGIGYPIKNHWLWAPERSLDLTPPCEMIEPPAGGDSKTSDQEYGGADRLVAFIQDTLKPFVESNALPRIVVEKSILMGHSYGGLFALHVLFTHSDMFDTYIAISPSIWWNAKYIGREETKWVGDSKKKLVLSYGSEEQQPVRRKRQSDESFAREEKMARMFCTGDNIVALYEKLSESNKLGELVIKEYSGETHISVAPCGISGGISFVYDE